MPRLTCIIIAILSTSLALAAEPYRVVITDVEKNVHRETAEIAGSEITPDCPVSWSVRKRVLHGGKQHRKASSRKGSPTGLSGEGVEVIEVNNGKLRFTVVPTRGMSIYDVSMADLHLDGLEGFSEWMVHICNAPASFVEVTAQQEAPYRIAVRGRIEQAAPHGPKLDIWTQISTTPGAASFQISDTVTNRSAVEQQFGVLYHSNYGRPLMEEGAKFFAPVRQVTPMNEHAATDVWRYDVYRVAQPGFAEQVYNLRLWADEKDRTQVVLRNAAGTRAVLMAFSVDELPFLRLWKNPAENYCRLSIADRGLQIENRKLVPPQDPLLGSEVEESKIENGLLGPHESRSFTIDFALHVDREQVFAAGQEVARIWAGRPTQTDTSPVATDVKTVTLNEIIKAARTWRPGYQTWYGKPAPDFTLTDLAGKQHKLSDYKGRNVLIIFWATWCGPCRVEIPDLIELRKTVSEDDLAMLAISNESPVLVKRFVEQAKMNYTILIDRGGLPGPYNSIRAIPSAFFIDRQGKMKLSTTGVVSLEEIKAIFDTD